MFLTLTVKLNHTIYTTAHKVLLLIIIIIVGTGFI